MTPRKGPGRPPGSKNKPADPAGKGGPKDPSKDPLKRPEADKPAPRPPAGEIPEPTIDERAQIRSAILRGAEEGSGKSGAAGDGLDIDDGLDKPAPQGESPSDREARWRAYRPKLMKPLIEKYFAGLLDLVQNFALETPEQFKAWGDGMTKIGEAMIGAGDILMRKYTEDLPWVEEGFAVGGIATLWGAKRYRDARLKAGRDRGAGRAGEVSDPKSPPGAPGS